MKRFVLITCAFMMALPAVSGSASARPGDRGENYDPLSRPRQVCHPEKHKGVWVRVCRPSRAF